MTIAILTIILGLGILAGCMIAQQERIIYMPRAYTDAELRSFKAAGLVRLTFNNEEGRQTAFWLPPTDPSPAERDRVSHHWLVFSGNGGCAVDYRDVARSGPKECGWLFVDYPGYGACEGHPTPTSIRANALGAIAALAEELGHESETLKKQLGSFGHSIGAAAALDIAAEVGMERAVIVSPFTSMKDMAARYVTPLLTGFLRHRFDNRASLRRLADQGGHVTILHGDADAMIPASMGRTLAEEFPEITTFKLIEGAGHNDVIDRAMNPISEALNSHVTR